MTDDISVGSQTNSAEKQVPAALLEEANYPTEEYKLAEQTDSDLKNLVTLAEDDPAHPLSWPVKKKIAHTILFGLTTFCAQFCATIVTAAVPVFSEQFHVGREIGVLAYSIYLLGNIPGPVLFAPVSELFGRKIGIMVPLFIAGVLVIITANVTSMWAILVLRFFSGVFAASPLVNAAGAMSDMWHPKQRVAALVLYAMMIVLGSVAAPLIGAALETTGHYGWRWGQWTAGLLTMVVALIDSVVLSESFVPVLESRIARHIRITTGRWAAHAKLDEVDMSPKEIVNVHLARPLMLFATPIVFFITIYSAFVYGLIFLLIGTVELLFVEIHHFPPVVACATMYAFLVGFLFGGAINIGNAARYGKIAQRIRGPPPPEEFLGSMLIFGWIMPAGFFIYGWSMYSSVHWIGPVIGLAVIGCGFAVIFMSCLVYLVASYTKYAASVLAANTMFRCILAGSFPLFGTQMYQTLNPRWASSLLGFLCLLAVPIPWAFYFYGARLRKISPFGKYLQ